jgi:hypothetical protein
MHSRTADVSMVVQASMKTTSKIIDWNFSRRRGLGASIAALLTARALLPAVAWAADPGPVRPVQDLWTSFWPVYRESIAWPSATRAKYLMTGFFHPNMPIYRAAEMQHIDVETITSWLPHFDPIAVDVRTLHDRFANDYADYARRFLDFLPDFDGTRSPITIMPSLLKFDAHLVPLGAELPLYFGLDGIVAFHGRAPNLGVLFSHETFHCYQGQRNPGVMLRDKLPVYAGLWIEGGATWVSERLNPNASPLNILLDDHSLLAIEPATLLYAMRAISSRFDSLNDADTAAFFTMDYVGAWPARVGYSVGLMLARRIAPTMPIGRFAALSLTEMRPLYRANLDALMARGHLASRGQGR